MRKLNHRQDWELLPFIVVAGLVLGIGMGYAAKFYGPALVALAH
jgi:hypothetical protein